MEAIFPLCFSLSIPFPCLTLLMVSIAKWNQFLKKKKKKRVWGELNNFKSQCIAHTQKSLDHFQIQGLIKIGSTPVILNCFAH